MKRRRAIEPEERALWHRMMQGVARYRRPDAEALEAVPLIPAPVPSADPPSGARRQPGDRHGADHANTAGGAGLDRRTALRLKRGRMPVEARLDLHGMTQAAAHGELAAFIARMSGQGRRLLLVITGKGTREGTGVLRQAVPRWLEEPGLRGRVLAIAPAVPRDGGDGALYVLLRRTR